MHPSANSIYLPPPQTRLTNKWNKTKLPLCRPLQRMGECDIAQLILNHGTIWMCGHLQAFKKQPPSHTEQDAGQARSWPGHFGGIKKKSLVLARNEIIIPWVSSL